MRPCWIVDTKTMDWVGALRVDSYGSEEGLGKEEMGRS